MSPNHDWNVGSSTPKLSFKNRRPLRPFKVLAAVLAVFALGTVVWAFSTADPGETEKAAPVPLPSPSPEEPAVRFKRFAGASAQERARATRRLIAYGMPVLCGAGGKPFVALTFDDGPGPLTPETLRLLKQARAPATFFVVGRMFKSGQARSLAKREAQMGEVGNHTWSHAAMAGAGKAEMRREIKRTSERLERVTGEQPTLFRPPIGSRDRALDRYVAKQDMVQVLWSLESRDSLGANTDQILRIIRKNLSPGDIILMHENRGVTLEALPQILEMVDEAGLQPVTVSDMLAQDMPSRAQVKSREC